MFKMFGFFRNDEAAQKEPPVINGNFVLGQIPAFYQKDGEGILALLQEIIDQENRLGTTRSRFPLGPKKFLVLSDPEEMRSFKLHHENDLSTDLPMLPELLGTTILNAPESEWKAEHQLLNQLLHKKSNLDKILPDIVQRAQALIQSEIGKEQTDLKALSHAFSLDIITSIFMGVKNTPETLHGFVSLLNDLTTTVFQFRSIFKFMLPWILRVAIYRGEENDLSKIRSDVETRFKKLVNVQNAAPLLDRISQEFGGESSEAVEKHFGRLLILMSAGSATTAASIQFCLIMLQRYPEIKAELLDELNSVELENLNCNQLSKKHLPLLDNFLKEVWRLYPPTPFYLPRETAKPFTLEDGTKIGMNDVVMASPFVMQRLEKFYKDPLSFNPHRFNDPTVPKPMPFSIGPRQCPGMMLAELEIKVFLITLLKNTDLQLEPIEGSQTDLELAFCGALSPKAQIIGTLTDKAEARMSENCSL